MMEIEIIKSLQSVQSGFLDVFFEIISYLSHYFGFVLLFLIFFVFIDKKYSLFFLFTYALSIGINNLLKAIIARPRPYQVDSEIINKLTATGSSFPSGHSVSAAIIMFFIMFWIWQNSKNKSLKITSLIISVILIILVIISRMYLGQHFLSDTLMGITLGTALSTIGVFLYNKFGDREKWESKS